MFMKGVKEELMRSMESINPTRQVGGAGVTIAGTATLLDG